MDNDASEKQWIYDPNRLLDAVRERLDTRSDAQLSRVLGVSPSMICKIRYMRLPVTASFLLRMHEVTDMSVRELRMLMGDDRRTMFPLQPRLPAAVSRQMRHRARAERRGRASGAT